MDCSASRTSTASRRQALQGYAELLPAADLVRWANRLDPGFRGGGRQRASRTIEIALLTGRPLSYWQQAARVGGAIRPWYVVLTVPRPVLHQRIERRAVEMVRRGLIEEVAAALADGARPGSPGIDGIGLREAVDYLQGRIPRDEVAAAVARSTRQYAKRQETWFRHQLAGPTRHHRRDPGAGKGGRRSSRPGKQQAADTHRGGLRPRRSRGSATTQGHHD